MGNFTIDGFAAGCKQAMAGAESRRHAAKAYLEKTLADNDVLEIVAALEAAIPEGADIGELIVHASPELTMLYGRIPPHFQSGIHNHTVFACIGQLAGEEVSVAYERLPDGGLRMARTYSLKAGEVCSLREDAIHHIENPGDETASALHIYGGDFGALMGQRSLWSSDSHEEKSFDFKELLVESIKMMKVGENHRGLKALAEAIPAVKPLVGEMEGAD